MGLRGPLRHQLSEGAGKKKKDLCSSSALLDIVEDVIFKNNKVTKKKKQKRNPDSAKARCANGVFSALVRADGTAAWGQRSPLLDL